MLYMCIIFWYHVSAQGVDESMINVHYYYYYYYYIIIIISASSIHASFVQAIYGVVSLALRQNG